jgi:hypothetical protein
MRRLLLHSCLLATLVGVTASAGETPPGASDGKFKLEPMPKEIVDSKGTGLAIRGYAKMKKAGGSGTLYLPSSRRLPFKVYSESGKGDADKLAIDWNANKKYTDDPVFQMPTDAKGSIQKATINGVERSIRISKLNKSAVLLRNTQWYRGKLEIDGKVRDAAIIDLDLNGIKLDGNEILLVDQNGDGKFSRKGRLYEGQMSLTKIMFVKDKAYTAEFDAKSSSLTVAEIKEYGKISITHPFGDKGVTISGGVRIGAMYRQLKIIDGTIKLPPGKYNRIRLNIQMPGENNKPSRLSYQIPRADLKANETLALTIQKPTGVMPKVRLVKGALKIGEQFVYKEAMKGITTSTGITANGKRAGAPKITVYKGTEQVAQGAMKYG